MGQNSPWFPLHFLWKEREQCKRIGWFYPVITDKASCFSVFLRLRKTQSLPSAHEVRELDGWGPRTLSVCPPPGIGHRRLLERVRLEASGSPENTLYQACAIALRLGRQWEETAWGRLHKMTLGATRLQSRGRHSIYENRVQTLLVTVSHLVSRAHCRPRASRILWGADMNTTSHCQHSWGSLCQASERHCTPTH